MPKYKVPALIAVLLLITLSLNACGGTAPQTTPTFTPAPPAQPTSEATPTIPEQPNPTTTPVPNANIAPQPTPAASQPRPAVLVDTQWVKANLGKSGMRLIDVSGSKSTYDEGHLPGAVYISTIDDLSNPNDPLSAEILTADALTTLLSGLGITNNDTLVLYDDTNNMDASRAYWALKYYRHPEVRIYDGGRTKWLGDGETLTADSVETVPSQYVAGAPDPALRTTWEYVVASIGKDSTLLCDVRSTGEFTGQSARSQRGGHVPGAIHVEWTQAVNPDGTFRSREELSKLYRDAGFLPEKEIITYCQVGLRAAHTWFVLHELLEYPNVRIYDGSWEEYGSKADSPIEK
jgi:thiosulfate/3-mercaptopyruvate sulfurtransferase